MSNQQVIPASYLLAKGDQRAEIRPGLGVFAKGEKHMEQRATEKFKH